MHHGLTQAHNRMLLLLLAVTPISILKCAPSPLSNQADTAFDPVSQNGLQ